MALADALISVANSWPELRRSLDRDEIRRVRTELATAVHVGTWDPGALLSLLLAHEPPEHPAWRALERDTTRRTVEVPSIPVGAAAAYLRFIIELGLDLEPPESTPEAVDAAAEERLLAVPMVLFDAIRKVDLPFVVSLRRDRLRLVPAFQFRNGRVLEAVRTVNVYLDAEDDPWGVASWWLTPHAGLHAIPADDVLIGNEENVIAAARAVGSSG